MAYSLYLPSEGMPMRAGGKAPVAETSFRYGAGSCGTATRCIPRTEAIGFWYWGRKNCASPSVSNMHEVNEFINELWQKIFERRPVLGNLMRTHGDRNLFAYTQDYLTISPSPLLDARREELVSTVRDLLVPRLGHETAAAVAAQLRASPLVSTTDHHGPLYHPFWLNANIVSSLPFIDRQHNEPQYLVVFSFSSISLNNASGWPRGIEFHGGERGEGPLIKLPLFPDKYKMAVVYRLRGYVYDDLKKAAHELIKQERAGSLAPARRQKLEALLNEFFADPHITSLSDLISQVTRLNFRLWPQLFHPCHPEGSPAQGGTTERISSGNPREIDSIASLQNDRMKPPSLIYLEIETLVTELLLRFHLYATDSTIHALLFNPQWRTAALRHFDSIAGAFSREKGSGTHFFWGVNAHLHRTHLDLDADALIIRETGACIPLTPDHIASALRDKTIFPSMLLCYLTVALHYGMKCLGGFCQVHDLTMIKEAWGNILEEFNMHDEVHALQPVQTKEFGGDGLVLSYLHSHGALTPATGIDMLISDEDTRFENFLRLAKEVTLREMMAPMLPEIYTVLYHAAEREKKFSALTSENIMAVTGLKEKLSSLLNT